MTGETTDTGTIREGTYARTRDGRHYYHSPERWRDASFALDSFLRREAGYRPGEWRQVTGAEHEAVHAAHHLAPGESVEVSADDVRYADAIREARTMGAEYGRAAGSWYFGGNTDENTYAVILRGIEDGDPEVLDTFPGPRAGMNGHRDNLERSPVLSARGNIIPTREGFKHETMRV